MNRYYLLSSFPLNKNYWRWGQWGNSLVYKKVPNYLSVSCHWVSLILDECTHMVYFINVRQRKADFLLTQCLMGVLYFFSANVKNTYSFEKYVRVKIEDHKILVLMSKLSPKFDEVNASYPCKYNSVLLRLPCISSIPHIIMLFFKKIRKNQNWRS